MPVAVVCQFLAHSPHGIRQVAAEVRVVLAGHEQAAVREIAAVELERLVGDAHPDAAFHQAAGGGDAGVVGAIDDEGDGGRRGW